MEFDADTRSKRAALAGEIGFSGRAVTPVEDAGEPPKTVAFSRRLADRSVTTEGGFYCDILRALNQIANEFTSQLAADIVAANSQRR